MSIATDYKEIRTSAGIPDRRIPRNMGNRDVKDPWSPELRQSIVAVNIMGEVIDTWPQFCSNGRVCIQCVIEGKIKCNPSYQNKDKEIFTDGDN